MTGVQTCALPISQNTKNIEHVDPLTSVLKEGNELYIKEPNGQITKINSVVRVEDGIKIPQNILDKFEKIEDVIDIDMFGKNSNQVKVHNLPVENINFVENIDEAMEIHRNIINQINDHIAKEKINEQQHRQDVEKCDSEQDQQNESFTKASS